MPKNVFAGVGISKLDDPYKAGREAVSNALEDMKKRGGKEPIFGFVFCSGGKYGENDKTIQSLVNGAHSVFSQFNDCKWIGCTTGGEISPFGSEKNSVSALVIDSEYLKFGIGIGNNVFKQPKKAGIEATKQAFSSLELDPHVDAYMQYMRYRKHKPSEIIKMVPYAIILLGKGLEKGILPNIPKIPDLDGVISGILETCGTQIPIVGGGAFDDWRMKKNYHFADGKVYKDAVIVVAMLSNLYFSTGLAHGYKPSGKVVLVNKVNRMGGAWSISEMNNKKALDSYSQLIGVTKEEIIKDPVKFGAMHPLGIIDSSGEAWVKVFGDIFRNNLMFGCKIDEKTVLHLMKGSEEEIFYAYQEAVKKSLEEIGKKKPAFVLVFSCACRNKVFGKKIGKEIDVFKKRFPDVPFIGFYTFSEFGSTLGYRVGVHQQSVTVLVVTDEMMI